MGMSPPVPRPDASSVGDASPDPILPQGQENHTRKRKRTPVACSACRNRKSRCDGRRPKCSFCQAQAIPCVYAQQTLSVNLVNEQSTVESRLRALENEIHAIRASVASSGQPSEDLADSITEDHDGFPDATDSRTTLGTVDGLGTIEFVAEKVPVFFGASSNISFTRLIRSALSSLKTGSQPPQQVASSRPMTPRPSYSFPLKANINASPLPPLDELVQLIKRYFGDTAMLFPYIHEHSFWELFEKESESNFHSARRSWMALLNMILAMATNTIPDTSTSGSSRSDRSEGFFNRAEALCSNELSVGMSLEKIQVMLLMAQYLQGTRRSTQTWVIHGQAVRAALHLGLHSEDALGQFTTLERETRIRTWYCCIALDRSVSMTFGRPPAIPEQYVRIRLPNHQIPPDKGDMLGHTISWSSQEASTMFLNATITLYQLLNKALDSLYGSNLGCGETVTVGELTTATILLEQQLRDWRSLLPPSIALIEAADISQIDVRILVHRSILDRHLQLMSGFSMESHDIALLRQIGALSLKNCLHSAETIISLVSAVLTTTDDQRAFNAGLTAAALFICNCSAPAAGGQLDQDLTTQSRSLLDQAIFCVGLLQSNDGMAEKCQRFMSTVRQYIQILDHQMKRQLEQTATSSMDTVTVASTPAMVGPVNGDSWPALDMTFMEGEFEGSTPQGYNNFMSPASLDQLGHDLLW